MTLRSLSVAIGAVVVLVGAPPAAQAGGSWLTADRYTASAGDTVTVRGEAHPGTQGWLDDGPFRLALRPADQPYGFESRPGDVPVGTLHLRPAGPALQVQATVTIPDVRPGHYELVYCDRTCTDGLGDLIGLDRPITITAPAVTSAPDGRESGPDDPASPWALFLMVGIMLAVASSLLAHRIGVADRRGDATPSV